MSTPAPSFSTPDEYRESNRRMAQAILDADPAPYVEGGYVRRVLEVRGRRTGTIHQVPIAVVTLHDCRYVVSPVRSRNWVRNLLADPVCAILSRDAREPARAATVEDARQIADIVQSYVALMNAPWAIAQFPFPPDADHAQIEAAAPEVAVFRLDQGPTSPAD